MGWSDELDAFAAERDTAGRRRRIRDVLPDGPTHIRSGGKRLLQFASNDYLGLAFEPSVREAAARAARDVGPGATASRLIVGSRPVHSELESRLAEMKRAERSLVFPSGFQCAATVIPALVGKGDLVLLDAESHASLIDGARLSGAAFTRFSHNDPDALTDALRKRSKPGRTCLAVIESVYSMSGDLAPVETFCDVCRRAGALVLIDEAHATGVFGAWGEGRCAGLENRIDSDHLLIMGTLSKALGSQGGFICSSRKVIDYLIQTARGFIYSTGLSPVSAAAALQSVIMLPDLHDRRETLRRCVAQFLRGTANDSESVSGPLSPIVPVPVGDDHAVMALFSFLKDAGVFIPAIRPPTVPDGGARLRLSFNAMHTPEDVDYAAKMIADGLKSLHNNPH